MRQLTVSIEIVVKEKTRGVDEELGKKEKQESLYLIAMIYSNNLDTFLVAKQLDLHECKLEKRTH